MGKLNADDWISAGFRALTLGGPQAIKIEQIAVDLKVSKGSFYWHFKNLQAYKQAMLDYWQQRGTAQVIAQVDTKNVTPKERLADLIATATEPNRAAVGGRQAEAAIRDWARYDKNVAATIHKIEQTRLEYVAALFEQTGQNQPRAARSARLLYATLIGLESLHSPHGDFMREDLRELLENLID